MNDKDEGTIVANGKHVVPPGVAVEEIVRGGRERLSATCPAAVQSLLATKNLTAVYDDMIAAICEEGKTRNAFGNWKDQEFVSILDMFADQFAEQGVRVVLCKRKSGVGTQRWLEFIDTDVATDYIPVYDVDNHSGQVIKTVYCTLEFPYGVAVEELRQWRGRKRLKDRIPVYVEKLMVEKNAMVEYEMLVEECIHNGVGNRTKMWNIKRLKEIVSNYRGRFEEKGIALFVSHKQEYVHHGNSGHTEYFRWLEFVDRSVQPNYYPQRDADTKPEQCIIS